MCYIRMSNIHCNSCSNIHNALYPINLFVISKCFLTKSIFSIGSIHKLVSQKLHVFLHHGNGGYIWRPCGLTQFLYVPFFICFLCVCVGMHMFCIILPQLQKHSNSIGMQFLCHTAAFASSCFLGLKLSIDWLHCYMIW